MTLKNTAKKTAKKQVNRVVATLALATAAGTAATPAFAADYDAERDDRGGHGLGHDDPNRAEFGGSTHGLEVKEDGTIEVHVDGVQTVANDVDDILSKVTNPSSAAPSATPTKAPSETPSSTPSDTADNDSADNGSADNGSADEGSDNAENDSSDGVIDLIGSLVDDLDVDDLESDAQDAVEKITGAVEQGDGTTSDAASEQDGESEDLGEGGKIPGADRSGQKGDTQKGEAQKGDAQKGENATGSDDADGTPGYWDVTAIDYGLSSARTAADLKQSEPVEDIVDPGGALQAFAATAKALGYEPGGNGNASESRSTHAGFRQVAWGDDGRDGPRGHDGGQRHDGDRHDAGSLWNEVKDANYEPRHLKADGDDKTTDGPRTLKGSGDDSRDVGAKVGLGDLEVSVKHSGTGVGAQAALGDLRVNVQAGKDGVSVDANLPGVAHADVGVGTSGAEVSVDDVAGADAADTTPGSETTASGTTTPADAVSTPGGTADGGNGHARESMLIADRGAEYAATGAQYVSNTETAVEQAGQAADDAAERAALDAPLRMATTGTEAATLTGLAGALVAGGAGALVMANRSGRREAKLSPVRPNNTY